MTRSLTLTAALLAASFSPSAVAQPAPQNAAPVTPPPPAPPATRPVVVTPVTPANAVVAPAAPVAPAAATPVAPAAPIAPVVAERITLAETPEPPAPPANPQQPPSTLRQEGPSPAAADAGAHRPDESPASSPFNIGFNLDSLLYRSRSFDLFSSSDNSELEGISLGYAVVGGTISLVPELGFGVGSESASNAFGGAIQSATLNTTNYYGGLGLRWAALSFLEPEVRVAAGASVTRVTLTPRSGPAELDEKNVSPFGTVGAGFTIHTPTGAFETHGGALRSVIVGLTVEGGYFAQNAVAINPSPAHSDGRIPTEDASLGDLQRSGPYLRVALALRF